MDARREEENADIDPAVNPNPKERKLYAELFLTKVNRLTYAQWQAFELDCNDLLARYARPPPTFQVVYTP